MSITIMDFIILGLGIGFLITSAVACFVFLSACVYGVYLLLKDYILPQVIDNTIGPLKQAYNRFKTRSVRCYKEYNKAMGEVTDRINISKLIEEFNRRNPGYWAEYDDDKCVGYVRFRVHKNRKYATSEPIKYPENYHAMKDILYDLKYVVDKMEEK